MPHFAMFQKVLLFGSENSFGNFLRNAANKQINQHNDRGET